MTINTYPLIHTIYYLDDYKESALYAFESHTPLKGIRIRVLSLKNYLNSKTLLK